MITNPYQVATTRQENCESFSVQQVRQCLHTKQQIINELIDGRLKLLDATVMFQAVHGVAAACVAKATGQPVAVADGENMCRTVIGWVYLTLSNRPEEAERVSASLEHELQGFLNSNGKIELAIRS